MGRREVRVGLLVGSSKERGRCEVGESGREMEVDE